ncbi:MAG TPA: C39 family peptidase [Methanotrichaceae archaeon]|nr:C39 family peptidase [Methanotrichaceae archaeon]
METLDPENGTTILLQVPDVRQSTNYSCGAACFQAVMRYWEGEDLREGQLMELLNTTPVDATDPDDMVRVAEKMGLEAEIRENLTLDDLKNSVQEGVPVIVAAQAWKYENDSWEDYENGHYMVVIGVDDRNVYLEDPSILGSRGYISRDEFVRRWHDYRDESLSNKAREFMYPGIFIRGDRPAENPQFMYVG